MPSLNGQLNLFAANSVIGTGSATGALAAPLSSIATPFDPAWELMDSRQTLLDTNFWSSGGKAPDTNSQPAYLYFWSPGFAGPFQGNGGTLFAFGPNTVSDESAAANDGVLSHIYARDGDVIGVEYGQVFQGGTFVNGISTVVNYYRAGKPVDILAGGDIVSV